jgi:hypothetical protein
MIFYSKRAQELSTESDMKSWQPCSLKQIADKMATLTPFDFVILLDVTVCASPALRALHIMHIRIHVIRM